MTQPNGYVATMRGIWDPGTLPAATPSNYAQLQQAIDQATRDALGEADALLDFHVISSASPGAPVRRSRWHLEGIASGPQSAIGANGPHDSQVTLFVRVYPATERRQVVVAVDSYQMPHRGIFSPVLAATLLRGLWGEGSRTLTVDQLGEGTFTPTEISFETFTGQYATVAYADADASLEAYPLVSSTSQAPTMWLVMGDGPQPAWQVSYVVPRMSTPPSERLDVGGMPAPEFTPLPWEA